MVCEDSGRDLAMAVKKRAKARETSTTISASKAVSLASGAQVGAVCTRGLFVCVR